MPIYQYQGAHYDLPDGLSNEEAIAKIKTHLGQSTTPAPEQPKPQQPEQPLPPQQVGGDWDLPLGILETGTTGVAQALGGIAAKAAGGIKGALTPGQTAAETGNRWAKNFAEVTDPALAPQTISGQRIQKGIGDFLQGATEYAQDPQNIQNTLRAIPFMPESVATEPHLGGIASAAIQAAPDLSMLTPMLGKKSAPEVKATTKPATPVGDPVLDALDKIDSSAKPSDIAPVNPLVDTRDSLAKSKLAYEQALREQELARQSAFNRPEQIGNLPQEDAMSRMARDLGAEPNKVETPVDTTTPMGNVADQLTKDVGNGKTMEAQDFIDARNAEHDKIAENLAAQRIDIEGRKQASNMDSSPSAEAQAHIDQIAAEEQHRAHIEETHAHALDEQNRLEAAQKAVEDRQKAIDASMSGVKSQFEGIRDLLDAKEPRNGNLAFEAELRRLMDEAPTKSKAQVLKEAKEKAAADKQRIVEQRAANEEMIQKLRDQHTESEIRTAKAQADAQEAIAKRNQANEADTAKAASDAASLRAQADALAKDKAKRDIALAKQAKQRAIQEITHPAGSKERAAAVKAVNEKFSNKPAKTGGASKKSQRGGVDPQVFKELYRGLAKGLSKLTDQPWLKARFPSNEWMTNKDGTPLVLLHGSVDKRINGEVKGMKQGFHAGFVSSPHIFTTREGAVNSWGVHAAKRTKNGNATKEGSRLYPVAIKKGNYPHLPFDIGDWSPWSVVNDLRSKAIIKDALIKKGTPESAIQGLFNYVTNGIGDRDKAQRLSDVLNRAGIDGFFYRNTAESPSKSALASISARSTPEGHNPNAARADFLRKNTQDPTSFVTWDNNKFQSIYKPTKGEVHPVVGDDVNTSKSKEAGLFGADKDGITELHSGIPLPKEIRDRLDNGMKYLADLADRRFGEPLTQAKNYVANSFKEARDVIGAVGNVTVPKDIIARAIAPGAEDIPLNPEATMKLPFNRRFNYGALSESVQSGLNMAALKFKENPVLRGVQEYLNTGLARTNYQISKIVVPLNKMINRLSPADIVTHDGILQREQKRGQAFTDDQLRAAGLSDKNLAAYKMQREAYDSAYKLQNEQLKRMGEKELSREDYYYSSRWTGDYHAPIFKDRIGVDGKPIIDPATNKPKQDLVWHIRTETRADGERALAYLKENYPELNIHKDGVQTKMMFIGDNRNPNAPRDIANTYRDMMGYLKDNPEATESISKIMESYLEGQGYKSVGQSKHFMVKTGIRGFAGDTPWLTPEESALKGTKSQIDYLKNAIRWANLQETVANAKEVLSHPDVIKNQPNAVALAQTILNRELGKDTNIVAPIENLVAKTFGVSRNSVLRLVGDVKGMTYLQTLGLNPMYSLATAFQFMFTGPMMHIVMSSEGGYKTGIAGAAKTLALGMSDATAGILAHMSHEMGSNTVEGFISKAGMTDIGKEALKFMENSGYIKRNIFDESRHVGQHGFMDKVQAGLGWTIGKPEQVARMMSFMSFVHHLDASGAFHGDHMAIFHEAEIYSDRALSSFKSFDRPLMVDKLGAIGQAGYVYQSFKFQSFHTTNAAVRLAARGNWKPLMALMVGYGLGTGLMNMPGMQELDGAVEGIKDLIAKMKPDWYTPEVRDFDLRDQMINHLPTTKIFRQMSARSLATNGLAGEATGLNMAPHVSPQVLDTEHLGNNFPGAVMAQEAKEWGSVGKMLIHPNSSTLTEAAYKNLPGAKGPMEEFLPNIKQGNTPGHQVFINPNDMNSPKTMPYTRNQDDEAARKINAVSAREGNLKQNWYRSNMEDARIKEALSGNINGFLGAYHRNNVGDMADYIKAYVKLDPESTRIDEAVNNGIPAQYMSQEDQRVANAKKLLVLQAIQRYRSMPK